MHPNCTASTASAAGAVGVPGVVAGGRQTNKRRTKEKKTTIRRSCDFCNGRKKKCDGDGVNRCSYCINKKNPHCIYSPRRPQKPRARKAPAAPTPTTSTTTIISPTTSRGGGGGAGGAGAGGGLLVKALVRPSLKRGRLGMSLATGLVGTQENAFLGDFFGCMGFLPLTCQSTVREAMVRILFSNDNDNTKGFSSSTGRTWPHPASAMMAMDEEQAYYGGGEGDMSIVSTARSPVSSMKQWEQQQQLSPSDPSTSMFWCAVALGALTQGRSVRSVAPYIRLAEAALVGNEEGVFSDAARAWTLMAYLYGFCGDSANFRNCQERAERCFHDGRTEGEDTSEEEEMRVLIEHADGLGIFYGDGAVSRDHVASYLQRSGPHPKAADATTASRLSQFVMQSYHRFGQAFFTDATAGDEASATRERAADASIEPAGFTDAGPSAGGVLHGSSRSDELSELLCGGDDDDDDDDDDGDALLNIVYDFCAMTGMSSANNASSAAAVVDKDVSASRGTQGRSLEERVHERGKLVLIGNEAMTPPKHTSQHMQRVMMAATPEYERLEGAVDRPEVRGGIGGLMLNCTSVVLKAGQKSKQACLERARLCVEVLVKYPGLMRFPMGLHISHLLIIIIATYEDRELYTILMVAYNPMRPEGTLRIPPFEEWEGIGNLCSHVYCRAIETRFGEKTPQQSQLQEEQPQPPQPPRLHQHQHQHQHQQPQQATLGHVHGHNGGKVHDGGVPVGLPVAPAAPAAPAEPAVPAYAAGVGGGSFRRNNGGGGEPTGSFTAGRGGGGGGGGVSGSGFKEGGMGGSGLKEEPLSHATYGSDLRYLQQAAATAAAEAEAAAAWHRRSPAPPTAVTNSPCSADGAASPATFSDDLDGATLCADMDPIVTPSMLGMRHQQAASLSAQMVPTRGGRSMVGRAPVAGTPPPAATVSSSSSSFATVSPNATGPWEAGSRPPASSRGGFPGLGEGGGGGGGSIDALEAVLNGEEDDDDDDGDGGSNFVQLDVLADLPEVKSAYLLSQAYEEAYDDKSNNSHNRGGGGGGGNDRRHAEAAYRETEEALGKASFMESTHAMMLGHGFRAQGGDGGGGRDGKAGFDSSGSGHDA